ncbi:hypothetical protein [Glacieibacterium frigidum]|uniref:Uncharacterized protein n=1 Tax=Glacieibacterium frigidum TaxID=2593303 RepID=A0A552U7A4_9SPHN|nr:hypothetical protein [Glacieibacterium frigidum]TRW14095.1 hypothetical protein FMM06_10205 [Glacieibacterium frigidum]
MSAARLARLRSVRAVELRVAQRELAALQRATVQAEAMGARIERLIADLPHIGPAPQAAAATRAALAAARTRLAARDADAAPTRSAALAAVQRLHTRVEVVDTALAAARREGQP